MTNTVAPFIVIPIVLVLSFVFQIVLNKSFDYQCGNCGEKFSVSPFIGALTPHSMGRKLIKCPSCGTWTWALRVRKDH